MPTRCGSCIVSPISLCPRQLILFDIYYSLRGNRLTGSQLSLLLSSYLITLTWRWNSPVKFHLVRYQLSNTFSGIGELKNIIFSWKRMPNLQCQRGIPDHNYLLESRGPENFWGLPCSRTHLAPVSTTANTFCLFLGSQWTVSIIICNNPHLEANLD